MEAFFFIIIVGGAAGLWFYHLLRKQQFRERERRIDTFPLPASIGDKIIERYPHLTQPQVDTVLGGLRDYFHLCHTAGRKTVSMPSQVVDVAWHEFILFTRAYQQFCKRSMGRFLHHVPAEAMSTPTIAQDGIKRAWKLACKREGISQKSPDRLPALFAMDAALAIPDGFHYALNCRGSQSGAYCATHIGCSGGCTSCGSSCGSSCGGGD